MFQIHSLYEFLLISGIYYTSVNISYVKLQQKNMLFYFTVK